MTGKQVRRWRIRMGLNQEQLATLLGYEGVQRRTAVSLIEAARRELGGPHRRLLEFYMAGHVPPDLKKVTGCETWEELEQTQEAVA